MKAILMSIRPELVTKILNGEKTIEVRKRFPKDYQGWVYIYCTKSTDKYEYHYHGNRADGKVVARFWCDKVEEIYERFENRKDTYESESELVTIFMGEYELCKESCLSELELYDYLENYCGYAIHINNLEVFDRPKSLSEFYCNYTLNDYKKGIKTNYVKEPNILMKKLTNAPQSWQYIEVEQ